VKGEEVMGNAVKTLLLISVVLAAVGAINWGLVGLFDFDLVAAISGAGDFGETNAISRTIYIIVGLAGILSLGALPILARRTEEDVRDVAYEANETDRTRRAA
jgi:uncharacterized membrane protein YuzA (DUF378 family)